MARFQNLGFRGDESTLGSGFVVMAVAGFPEPGEYPLPTGLENFLGRTSGSVGVEAVSAGTRFLVLPRGFTVSGRSLRPPLGLKDLVTFELERPKQRVKNEGRVASTRQAKAYRHEDFR